MHDGGRGKKRVHSFTVLIVMLLPVILGLRSHLCSKLSQKPGTDHENGVGRVAWRGVCGGVPGAPIVRS